MVLGRWIGNHDHDGFEIIRSIRYDDSHYLDGDAYHDHDGDHDNDTLSRFGGTQPGSLVGQMLDISSWTNSHLQIKKLR